ncbi:MAG: phosphoribosyl-ATP diphosphatase, partial [Gammaproteobacteria bacterium TMED92]
MANTAAFLDQLDALLAERKGADPESSYTASLYARGTAKIAQKVGEEAVETVIAAIENNRDHLIAESADLVFHLLVLLKSRGISFSDVEDALAQRTLRSGVRGQS